jgi:hypothetical protein
VIITGVTSFGCTTAGHRSRTQLDWRQRHSPGKAGLSFGAVLPGAGQALQPQVLEGADRVGRHWAPVYFMQRTRREYRRYKDAYIALVDNDPTTIDEFNGAVQFAPRCWT